MILVRRILRERVRRIRKRKLIHLTQILQSKTHRDDLQIQVMILLQLNLNILILMILNNEFRRKAMGKTDMRSK